MTSRRPLAARIFKVLIEVFLVIGGIGGCLLVIWLLVSPLLMTNPDIHADVGVFVAIGERSVLPIVPLEFASPPGEPPDLFRPHLVKARGELSMETNSWWLQAVHGLRHLVRLVLLLFVFWNLREFLKTVLAGEPFAASNSRRLRAVGFLLILGGLALPATNYLFARAVLERVTFEGWSLAPDLPSAGAIDSIWIGLLFLVFSTAFGHGTQIEEEKALTI